MKKSRKIITFMSRKSSSLSARSLQGFNITLIRNGYSRAPPRMYHFTTLKKLINESHELLSLPTFAKKVYTLEGKLIKEDSEVQPKMTLVVSCGEPFNSGKKNSTDNKYGRDVLIRVDGSKSSINHKEEEEEEEAKEEGANGRRLPSRTRSIYDSVSFLFKKDEPKEEEEDKPDTSNNNKLPKVKLPRSTKTVEDQFRDENYARFCQLDRKDMMKVPNSLSIRAMIRNTQREMFIQSYVDQSIKSDITIEKKVADLLYDRKPLEIRYAIVGPGKSGRSSVLYELAKSLFVKLQTSKILVFMANFDICDPSDLYGFIINTTIYSLKYCAYQINPLADILAKWLLTIPKVESLSQLPSPFFAVGNVNGEEIRNLGRDLHKAYHKTDQSSTEFYKVLATVPIRLAKACGLEHVYYVIDHLDTCPDQLKKHLAFNMLKDPFVVSARDNNKLVQLLPNIELIETEKLIRPADKRVLTVPQLKLRLDALDCLGCPTYIKAFTDLCNAVGAMKNKATVKNKYSPIKSSIDESRRLVAVEKLKALCESLLNAGSKVVSPSIVNSIDKNAKLDFVINGQPDEEEKLDQFAEADEYEAIEGSL
ncbi:hypothetical protein TRFO_32911 [Tritrichomonas foetus]|uniref:Doublecortin domain-containing protein n=1 Tax=Tritrichomonas foetus TaxID=1144522 RepID=A0A1J4JT19_9EUKA|nr:hypothetical protein TRFO_32911 [Tritrichomonas foetus]|eukprot:OHT00413.1 hypothetical protein TRFO_32911 [Tritrichomonas foetus]